MAFCEACVALCLFYSHLSASLSRIFHFVVCFVKFVLGSVARVSNLGFNEFRHERDRLVLAFGD